MSDYTYYVNSGSWHVCPICEKRFFVGNPGEYVYKRHSNKTMEFFCRYNHMRQWEREHDVGTKRRYERSV